jgi:hypothetical protein
MGMQLGMGTDAGPESRQTAHVGASRRICGVKTFSAMSIPARMFNYV